MDDERETLMDSLYTHIGIGLAGNETNISVVLLVTRKDLTIMEITEPAMNQVDVRGKILSSNHFVFMADVYDSSYK